MGTDDVKLWLGDCLDLMNNIEDKSVDAIICDLPYGSLNKKNSHAKWDSVIPFKELWKQYNRVIKPNGVVILFAQGMFTAELMMSNRKMWKYNLIWKKGNRVTGFLNAKKMPLRNHEDICVFYKKLPTYNPQMTLGKKPHGKGNGIHKNTQRCYGDFHEVPTRMSEEKYPISIIDIPKEHYKWLHPTSKPVALIEYLIKTYTNEGDLVLDNAAGSMTTAIAAINTKRKSICIEKDEHYFSIGKERVENYLNDKK